MQLTTIASADYARDVLPRSRTLWANGRSFDDYVADFHAVAQSAYGRRRIRTVGLCVDGQIVVSCKRYERELRCADRTLQAVGIGAVFTPEELRGRGYASALIGTLLDAERAAGSDVAFLFSDIHPAFYERLGFIALPSRAIYLRADALPATRLPFAAARDRDWPEIARCFERLDDLRPLAFQRTPHVWDWLRIPARSDLAGGQPIVLVVRAGRGVGAYVLGRRLPRTDTFRLDEFGYTGDDGFDAVAPLIRSAAGDLGRVTGWLPPDIARRALPRGSVKKRKNAIMMIAPLSSVARAAWRRAAATILADGADRCWSTDHI